MRTRMRWVLGLILASCFQAPMVMAQITCNPTAFVSVVGCKIAFKGCPVAGVTACSLCNPNDPTSRVVVEVLGQTNAGLQVNYVCPNGSQNTLLPASELMKYTVTTCP